jgi:ElaB/YqjD/DUF883 family membrane-anchored ribosome-binding protein
MAAIGEKPFTTSNDMSGREPEAPRPQTGETASGSTMPADHHMKTTSNDVLGGVVQGAHETIDKLAQTVEPHVRRLQEGIGTRAEHMKELGDEWTESLRCTVRENPLAAVATAVALGVLIARLTQR